MNKAEFVGNKVTMVNEEGVIRGYEITGDGFKLVELQAHYAPKTLKSADWGTKEEPIYTTVSTPLGKVYEDNVDVEWSDITGIEFCADGTVVRFKNGTVITIDSTAMRIDRIDMDAFRYTVVEEEGL